MDALEKYDLENDSEISKPKFQVKDLSSATWVMRKLRALDANDSEINVTADDQIQAIQGWRDQQLADNDVNRGFLEGYLGAYLDKLREDDPKARIKTPYGTVSTRKTPASVQWNEKNVLASLEDQSLTDFIRIKKEPDKKAIKKAFSFVGGHYLNADGQELKGAIEKPEHISLVVKTDVPTP
ncbi:host-nuclease inhibitor Gam family protein [Levilactobacillus humaensis]|uniref:host-nuclease inhibitor Gam family protein n=1 Tax=Levilactobacillus humaensis TaxID=2950375 RepID=UPI0021C3FD2E|nr:host-nuclease inhibitor Gam family protein [Levilactobacillus humaensis]